MNEITMQVRCEDEDCGMVSAYRFYADNSFRRILEACCHPKQIPTKEKIREALIAKVEKRQVSA